MHKDAYLTVSAFTNTQSGWLQFVVSENTEQLDIARVDPKAFDRMQDTFLSTLRSGQKLNHIVHSDAHVYELKNKRVLAFHISELNRRQKPLYLNVNPWDTYIRRGARNEKVTACELQCFLRDSSLRRWDSGALTQADIENDLDTLHWYQGQFYRHNPQQRSINDPHEFLEEWNFLIRDAGQPRLTQTAMLLFGVDHAVHALVPRPTVDYQRIDIPFEHWSADERWHDRMVLEENLIKIWRNLVAKYSRIVEYPFRIDPSTLRHNDDPPDYIAFRETVINLLIHQDYGGQNRKASIKWFTDRLVFRNPDNAFASTTDLSETGEQDIRNPLVVNAFRHIGLSDQAGTGIHTIVGTWCKPGRVAPQIRNDKGGKFFELILQQRILIAPTMRRFQQQIGVNLDRARTATLAQAAVAPTVQVADAAMIAGVDLVQVTEALDFSH